MGLTLADATMRFFESAADDYDNSDDFFENIFEKEEVQEEVISDYLIVSQVTRSLSRGILRRPPFSAYV